MKVFNESASLKAYTRRNSKRTFYKSQSDRGAHLEEIISCTQTPRNCNFNSIKVVKEQVFEIFFLKSVLSEIFFYQICKEIFRKIEPFKGSRHF